MKTFPKKLYKVLSPEFTDSVQGMSKEEIEAKILLSEGRIYEIEDAVQADEELAKAKEQAKEMAASYKESKAKEMAQIKFCLWILEERGQDLGK